MRCWSAKRGRSARKKRKTIERAWPGPAWCCAAPRETGAAHASVASRIRCRRLRAAIGAERKAQHRPTDVRLRDTRDAAEPVLPGRWRPPLRGKAPQPTRGGFASMTDAQLLRYSPHILLPQMGVEGPERGLGAHALIIGVGGPGSASGPHPGRG